MFFNILTGYVISFTLVGTGYGELWTLLLVFTLNKLTFSCNVAMLTVNLMTYTLILNMIGQISSL